MTRHDVENILAVFNSTIRFQLVSEHDLLTRIVHLRTENETTACCRRSNRPARKCTRNVDHILLCVSSIDTKRVQLEQLSAVILVESAISQLIQSLLDLLTILLTQASESSIT